MDARVADEAVAGLRRELVREVGAVALGRHRGVRLASAACYALALLVLVTAVWGITFVQVKDALALYPLFAFLAVRFAIASATLAVPGRRTLGSLGRDGWRAGVVLGLLLAAGLRAPDRRARAHDRLQHRLHHRPLRRLHADPRRAPLRCADRRGRVGRRRALDGRPRAPHRDRHRAPRRRPARPRRVARLLAPDRADGARRAALRRRRADARGDARGLRGLHGRGRRGRSARGAARVDGLGRADRHRGLRLGARVPRADVGAAAPLGRRGPRSPSRSSPSGPRSSASGSPATGSAPLRGSGAC